MGFVNRLAGVLKKTYARGKQDYDFEFFASETPASCVINSQDEGLISTTVTRSSDGVYVFTFAGGERFLRIYGYTNVCKTADWGSKVLVATDGGGSVNTFTVEVDAAGTLDDPEAKVWVHLELVDSEP